MKCVSGWCGWNSSKQIGLRMSFFDWIKELFGAGKPRPPQVKAPSATPLRPARPVSPASQPTTAKPVRTQPSAREPPQPTTGAKPSLPQKRRSAVPPVRLSADLLQFDGAKGTPPTDLVVGFDFGTSSSKVVLQSPYKLESRAVAVDFVDLGHPSFSHLLPSVLVADSNGLLALRRHDRAREIRHDLKVRLLANSETNQVETEELQDDIARAAAYVGLALREVRRKFLIAERDNYGADRLRWSMNLGIPSAGYDDDITRERFGVVARAGWFLSLSAEPVSVPLARAAVDRVISGDISDVTIRVVPEVAAQVVGYAKSRQRNEGLHFLLDIGASTIDLCAFVLHARAGDDIYELLSVDVKQLGLLALHDARMQASKGRPPFDTWPEDLALPIPEWAGLENFGREARRELRNADTAYVNNCARNILFRMMTEVRRERDPHSPHWTTGLPLFVCGGGSAQPLVADLVSLADSIGQKNWTGFRRLRLMQLPLPNQLAGNLSPSAFQQRMSVAYGLSFPEINIGTIEPPSVIDDVLSRPDIGNSRWKDRFVDKDQT